MIKASSRWFYSQWVCVRKVIYGEGIVSGLDVKPVCEPGKAGQLQHKLSFGTMAWLLIAEGQQNL